MEPLSEENKIFGSEDEKYNLSAEETAMDYVNKTHDYTKLSEEDLSAAFNTLRKRCPQSWTKELENLARSFHKKIITLKNQNSLSQYIYPGINVRSKGSKAEYDEKNLIISPEGWDMEKIEA